MRPTLTTIGSLPPQAAAPREAAVRAVEVQRAHGVELFTDGEQRGDMLALYESLPGVHVEGGKPRIVDRIRPPEDPAQFSKIQDLAYLRARFPDCRFKVSLTGPTTFIFASASTGAGPAYRSAMDPSLHEDMTEAIRVIAAEVNRSGADLQVDDPLLSQGMRDFGPTLDRLDRIASEVPRERASLHVCGGLGRGKVLESLLRLNRFGALDLAFAGSAERGNLELLRPEDWRDRGLHLGAGVANVQVTRQEEVTPAETVAQLLGRLDGRMGRDCLRFVMPDCGLRATALEFVHPILSNLRTGFEQAFR